MNPIWIRIHNTESINDIFRGVIKGVSQSQCAERLPIGIRCVVVHAVHVVRIIPPRMPKSGNVVIHALHVVKHLPIKDHTL